mgnify:FL=1
MGLVLLIQYAFELKVRLEIFVLKSSIATCSLFWLIIIGAKSVSQLSTIIISSRLKIDFEDGDYNEIFEIIVRSSDRAHLAPAAVSWLFVRVAALQLIPVQIYPAHLRGVGANRGRDAISAKYRVYSRINLDTA